VRRRFAACLVFAVAVAFGLPHAAYGQAAGPPVTNEFGPLLSAIERAMSAGDPAAYIALLHPAADLERALEFSTTEMRKGATRTVVRERHREPVDESDPAAGQLLILDTFAEYGHRARAATWAVRAIPMSAGWQISAQERLSAVDTLYRLSLDSTRRFRARNFLVTAEDVEFTLVDGHVYLVNADNVLTGLVLVGRGEMRFRPDPASERRQVEIFGGSETLETGFDAAFIRAADIDRHADRSGFEQVPLEARELQRAQELFATESIRTYVLDLGDLTTDTWSIIPANNDFVAEVMTRRFDSLTYVHASSEPENILLFDRANQRTISSYRSRARLAASGPFFSEETSSQYDVLDIDVDAAYAPQRFWLEGRTRMRVRAGDNFGGQMNVRLAETLAVESVESDEFGRLFHLRVRGQNLVVVNLPGVIVPGSEFWITVTYRGPLVPQAIDRELVQAGTASQQGRAPSIRPPTAAMAGEPLYLYSSRAYWYAQNPIGDYSTARMRISVPAHLTVIATGSQAPDSPTLIEGGPQAPARRLFEFTADRPVRYLSFLASRFTTVDRVTLAFDDAGRGENGEPAPGGFEPPAVSGAAHDSIALAIEAHPLQVAQGRTFVERAADVFLFYRSIIGDAPYGSFTLALVENSQPGGHSPAHFATLHQRLPNAPPVWRTDPVNFPSFGDFYLAHEVAHQWWGQGVGWQNYHEQWLSEGISQYFAAMYAQHSRGDEVFGDVLRQMREWAIERSDQGPVYLGFRLGHVQNDSRTFRALVYNKGGAVMHMLRRLVGDDAFFRGLQRFYVNSRYRRVGTEDLRHAMEIEADRSLERFFQNWIYEAEIARITYAYSVQTAPVHEVAIRIEQTNGVFDLPVTMTLEFENRTTRDIVIPVTEQRVEVRIPLDSPLRSMRMSERDGTLAEARRVAY